MKTQTIIMSVALTALLSACVHVEQDVKREVQQVKQGPEAVPERSVTDFTDGLRCMDNMFLTFGIGNVSILMEDLVDQTEAVKAGTRDMMISAISAMTKRSHAVTINAFGKDTGNLVSILAQAEQKSVYDQIPPFDIRGSISQLDKDIVRKQADAGAAIEGTVGGSAVGGGIGASKSASGSVLGLDLSIVTTHNLSVVPGVTASNTVVIFKSGKAIDADATISKLGVNFSVVSNKSEGTTQALRALIELASIELLGKLFKVPYWKCLGLDPEHEQIKNEVSDWFFAMNRSGTFTTFMKEQLYVRGFYEGEFDGTVDENYLFAVQRYGERLGIATNGQAVDLPYFEAFLNSTPIDQPLTKLAYSKPRPQTKEEKEALAANPPVETPLSVSIVSPGGKTAFAAGEPVALEISANTNGFLYCFYVDGDANIVRFFPNRFITDNFVSEAGRVLVPGAMPFEITANEQGRTESVSCYLTTRDVFADLPGTVRKQDFAVIDARRAEEVSAVFNNITRGRYGEGTFTINVQ